jgi:mono/diheme cytochrome c family protein
MGMTRAQRWVGIAMAASASSCRPEPEEVAEPAAPPPISGGTLLTTGDGHAVAADPDRDRVWIVDLDAKRVTHEVALAAGDEPGRGAADAKGNVHVALRGSGQIATIRVASGEIVARTPVCAAPRGIAYDAGHDTLHVACTGGDLVTLSAADRHVVRRVRLDRDLRDVMVNGDVLLVTRFRSAELLTVDATGQVVARDRIADSFGEFAPVVAWRATLTAQGQVIVAHQRAKLGAVALNPAPTLVEVPGGGGSAYGGGGVTFESKPPDPIVASALSVVASATTSGAPGSKQLDLATLPVDVAVSPSGTAAIAAAGSGTVLVVAPDTDVAEHHAVKGQPIAVVQNGQHTFWVQTRRPAVLQTLDGSIVIPLGQEPPEGKADAGHDVFHLTAGAPMACASCHPEGGDDGHVWKFLEQDQSFTFGSGDKVDPVLRRTLNLRGSFMDGPLHWDGKLANFDALVAEVMVHRMGASQPGHGHVAALAEWLEGMRRIPAEPARDPAAAERGRALFNDATVGCATCHSGNKLTNARLADVGTGETLKVPSLVGVADRPPFMHSGCAATLADRFGPCGGNAHGNVSQLDAGQRADLISYLETL